MIAFKKGKTTKRKRKNTHKRMRKVRIKTTRRE